MPSNYSTVPSVKQHCTTLKDQCREHCHKTNEKQNMDCVSKSLSWKGANKNIKYRFISYWWHWLIMTNNSVNIIWDQDDLFISNLRIIDQQVLLTSKPFVQRFFTNRFLQFSELRIDFPLALMGVLVSKDFVWSFCIS